MEDVEKSMHLAWESICLSLIGSVMVLASLVLKVGLLARVGAFLATNPWFIPLFIVLLVTPLLIKIAKITSTFFTKESKGKRVGVFPVSCYRVENPKLLRGSLIIVSCSDPAKAPPPLISALKCFLASKFLS